MNPIGVFGGTFDPIHYGHLRLAQELATGLGLAEVRFIPSGHPPHRGVPVVSSRQRLEMVRLGIAGNSLFSLDEREVLKQTPSYSVETLAELRRELGEDQPLCLLMGADAFLGLNTWHRWRELFELAHIVVAHRPGFPLAYHADSMHGDLESELQRRLQGGSRAVHEAPHGAILAHGITALGISASRIRTGLKAGESPRYLLPDAVLDYIQANRLYTKESDGT